MASPANHLGVRVTSASGVTGSTMVGAVLAAVVVSVPISKRLLQVHFEEFIYRPMSNALAVCVCGPSMILCHVVLGCAVMCHASPGCAVLYL